jgi:hypothetical protein
MSGVFRTFDPDSGLPRLHSGRCTFLLNHWNRLRGDRPFPLRREIEPADLIPVLPHLMLVGIEYDPFRVRYRLVGTEMVRYAKFDFTGRYADSLAFQDDEAADWTGYYRAVADTRQPGIGQTDWTVSGGIKRWMEFIICPLSTTGSSIDRCIAIEDYEHTTPVELDRLPPVAEQ